MQSTFHFSDSSLILLSNLISNFHFWCHFQNIRAGLWWWERPTRYQNSFTRSQFSVPWFFLLFFFSISFYAFFQLNYLFSKLQIAIIKFQFLKTETINISKSKFPRYCIYFISARRNRFVGKEKETRRRYDFPEYFEFFQLFLLFF